ncbi:MAG TPA: hemerythrin domain-containing protein [Acidimicrobiales bacterium]|jgi:hemerythrin superfamily protein|nr:hemerythrin domain-containing protein [Acidimicrobiales bacterium]
MSADGMTGARADAIELLTEQHREVEQLWRMLEVGRSTETGQKIVEALSRHDAIETQLLYPELREAGGEEGKELSAHSLDEHKQVRELLTRVDGKDFGDDAVFATMRECVEAVMHHVQEEESTIFPLLRSVCDEPRLMDLGTRMAEMHRMAPTHPHPHTPDSKVGATVAGAVSAVVDRARDAMREASDRG